MNAYRKALAMETASNQVSNILNRNDLREDERSAVKAAHLIMQRLAYEASCQVWANSVWAKRLDAMVIKALNAS